jgi:hypothetical protein
MTHQACFQFPRRSVRAQLCLTASSRSLRPAVTLTSPVAAGRSRNDHAPGWLRERPSHGVIAAALIIAIGPALASCGSPAGPRSIAAASSRSVATSPPAASASRPGRNLSQCRASQWDLTRQIPEGDGPDFFIWIRAAYVSGPRCVLAARFSVMLLTETGKPVASASATGVLHSVIGPLPDEKLTPQYAFLWSNWCQSAQLKARITWAGGRRTENMPGHPMCIDAARRLSIEWRRV